MSDASSALNRFTRWYGALIMFYHLVYASGILLRFNIDLGGIHGAISMGLLLSLLYLTVPMTKKSRITVLDILLAVLSLLPSAYFAMNFERALYASLTPNLYEVTLGIMLILLLFEGCRRSVGLPITIVGIVFFVYPLLAPRLPGILFAARVPWKRLIGEIFMGTQGIFSTVAMTFATVISVFIIFGQIFDISKGGAAFLDLALTFIGSKRGGPAKAAVIGSAAFGTMSGVAVANVVTTGAITIPLMKRTGFDKDYAGAVEAVASTGGAIMPPVMGVLAFVMADFLQVPYWSIASAAILPAILYYLSIYMQVDLQSGKLGLKGIEKSELPQLKKVLPQAWPYFLPLVLMLYLFMFKGYSATRVGFAAVALIFAIFAITTILRTHEPEKARPGALEAAREIGGNAVTAFSKAGNMLSGIIPAAGVAGIIMTAVNVTALGLRLSGGIVELAGNNLFLLLVLAAVACYIMGTAIDLIVIYLVLAVLVAPALIRMGVLPIAAHMFILYYTVIGLITPPVCMSVYAACAISGGNIFKTGFQAMKLGFVALVVPFMFVYKPTLLLRGSIPVIVFDALTAVYGVVSVALALEGYFFKDRISALPRILLGVGGFLCIMPSTLWTIVGFVISAIGAALSVVELRKVEAGRAVVR